MEKSHFAIPLNKQYFLCLCEIPGCTQVFNYKLKKILQRTAEYANAHKFSHDAWTNVAAAFCGTILFDANPFTLHRSHADSITNRIESGWQKYSHMAKIIGSSLKGGQYVNYGRGVYETLWNDISDEKDRALAEAFAEYKVRWSAKKKLLLEKEIKQGSFLSTALLKTCILLSRY